MLDVVQDAISAFAFQVEEKGFQVRPSQDPNKHMKFAEEVGRTNNHLPISTIFNPDYCHLGSKNFLWMEVRTSKGRPVACVTTRAIQGDVLSLIRTGRLWGEKRPVVVPSTRYVYPDDAPRLIGKAVYTGGLYIHPDFRHLGLAEPLARLTMSMSERLFNPDWHFCLQFKETRRRAIKVFGYTACYPILEAAYRPGAGEPKDMWLCCLQTGESSRSKTTTA